jgi:NADH dehydrogenase
MSKRIVIIGGGFAGLSAAGALAKRGNDFQVILIDMRREFTFSPWLIDALAGEKSAKEYTIDLEAISKREHFTFIQGVANRIDRDAKMVDVQGEKEAHSIGYDCLINCPGAKTAYYNIPGAKDHSLPLKNADDVSVIHERIDDLVAKGTPLNIAVVGAGPSGVESLFALRSFVDQVCAKAGKPELAKSSTFSLVQGAPQILPGFPNTIVDGTMRELGAKGFRVYLGEPVSEVTEEVVKTSKGSVIPANLVLWCAGIEANLVPVEPTVIADRAGYAIDRNLAIEPMVFSGGDAANYKETNVVIPKNAQTAMPMGVCLAENAARACQDLPPINFTYANRGNLIRLGETGFLDFRLFCLKTSLAPRIRNWFYKIRFTQMGG